MSQWVYVFVGHPVHNTNVHLLFHIRNHTTIIQCTILLSDNWFYNSSDTIYLLVRTRYLSKNMSVAGDFFHTLWAQRTLTNLVGFEHKIHTNTHIASTAYEGMCSNFQSKRGREYRYSFKNCNVFIHPH